MICRRRPSAPGLGGSRPLAVGCAVLQAELAALSRSFPGLDLRLLPSRLHMDPERLGGELAAVLDAEAGRRVLLVYGDCCPAMGRLAQRPLVARTAGCSCCELLLGHEPCRRLLRAGAFFLLPEWMRRWREVFTVDLGLDEVSAPELMGDLHTCLVYLDTGLVPVPAAELAACAAFCRLPAEVRRVPLDHLRRQVEDGLAALAC